MKAYNKWWEKEVPFAWNFVEDKASEIGWKAALEWVLTQGTDLQSTELAYHVREELKDD